MGLFDQYLNEGGIITNPEALRYDYTPRTIPHRDTEMHSIAHALTPLLNHKPGRNILITGQPGIGKTLVVKKVLEELEEATDVLTSLVNCWKTPTVYKIYLTIVESTLTRFTQNKKTDELARLVTDTAKAQPFVIVFDEIDKAQETDFLYTLLEDAYLASLILITNDPAWYATLDERIRSRLMPVEIPFQPYTKEQIKDILAERVRVAFKPGSIPNDVLDRIVRLTHEAGDIRYGLFLLREAGEEAEMRFKRTVTLEDVERAIAKSPDFSRKPKDDMNELDEIILSLVKEKSWTSGELYKAVSNRLDISYKTFQRRVHKLAEGGYILLEKTSGSQGGRTTRISSVINT